MNNNNNNKFFTISDINQYQYFKLPKGLFQDTYIDLSLDAKFTYGLLLDRLALSQKNSWIDDNGHVYVIFTRQELMQTLSIGAGKATKIFKELAEYDLISEVRQGLTKSNLIFVKKILTIETENMSNESENCRDSETEGQDMQESATIKTNNIKTDYSNTESINQPAPWRQIQQIDDRLIDEIRKQIDYDYFADNMQDKLPVVDTIV